MIPKALAVYWHGDRDPSWLRMQTVATFAEHHTGWVVTFVRERSDGSINMFDGNGGETCITTQNGAYHRIKLPPEVPSDLRCDMFRWYWLEEHGGFFVDLDVLFLRVIPETWCELDTLLVTTGGGTSEIGGGRAFAIGLMGAPPKDPIVCELNRAAAAVASTWDGDHQMCGTRLLARRLAAIEKDVGWNVANLPVGDLYPQGFRAAENYDIWVPRPERTADAILAPLLGLHWGGGHEMARVVERRATEAWGRINPCLVARAWRQAMGVPER